MGEALTLTPFDFLALFSIGIVFLLFIKNKLTPRRPDVELSSSVSAQAATSQKEIKVKKETLDLSFSPSALSFLACRIRSEMTMMITQCFSREEVAKHNRKDDCWLIINGKVRGRPNHCEFRASCLFGLLFSFLG